MRCVIINRDFLNIVYEINILTEENVAIYLKNISRYKNFEFANIVTDKDNIINNADQFVRITDFYSLSLPPETTCIYYDSFVSNSFIENILDVIKANNKLIDNRILYQLVQDMKQNYKKYVEQNLIKSIIE